MPDIPGGNSAPYRTPCAGGSSYIPFLGSPYQQQHHFGSASVYLWNTTVPSASLNVAPFELYSAGAPSGCPQGSPTGQVWGPQSGYTLAAGQYNTVPEDSFIATGSVNNNFCRKAGRKSVAGKRQWHGRFGLVDQVQPLSKICFVFDRSVNNGGTGGGFGILVSGSFEITNPSPAIYQPNPPQVKYLTQVANTSCNITAGSPPAGPYYYYSSSYDSDYSVDVNSGVINGSGYSNIASFPAPTTLIDPSLDWVNNTNGKGFENLNLNWVINYFAQFNILEAGPSNQYFTSGSAGNYQLWNDSSSVYWPTSSNILLETITIPLDSNGNPTTGAYSRTMYGPYSSGSFDYWNTPAYTETVDISNTSFTYTINRPELVHGDGEEFTYTATLNLSNANAASSVVADNYSLLNYWDLSNDYQYPWQWDGLEQMAPLMQRNERPTNVVPPLYYGLTVNDLRDAITDGSGIAPWSSSWTPTYAQIPWFDPDSYEFVWAGTSSVSNANAAALSLIYDGSVLGAPLIANSSQSYQGKFLWNWQDWRNCDSGWYQYGQGAYVQDVNNLYGTNLPLAATNLTNAYEIIDKPNGASITYFNYQAEVTALNPNALWVYKAAYTDEPWPAQQFFVGGSDKFLIDETQVYCIDSLTTGSAGGTFHCSPNAPSNILTGYWGGASVGGWYSGCTADTGSNIVTLGTRVFNFPSSWASVSNNEDTSTCFGVLRWPTVPGLRGAVPVAILNNTGSFDSPQTSFGMAVSNQETVDFLDQGGNILNPNVTVTRISDTQFLCSGSYSKVKYCQISGGPGYQWDDQWSKGQFLTFEWTRDWRTNGEATRLNGLQYCDGSYFSVPATNLTYANNTINQGCVSRTACCPSIVAFLPPGNIESATWGSSSNVAVYNLPAAGSVILDELYSDGSLWQGILMQTFSDLRLQVPHRPCGEANNWTQDPNATCPSSDGYDYYQFPMQVEAFNYPPANAPTASLIEGGASFPVYISCVNSTASNALTPPGPIGFGNNGYPNSIFEPWQLRYNLCQGCGFYYPGFAPC